MADSWLKLYMQYTSQHEAPDIFHFWNGVGILSAALGRRVWIDRGFYTIYPNPFIVLVAGSALCRKTTSINISTKFIDQLECVRIIDGKIGSVEMLMQKMSWTGPKDEIPPTTLIKADELSVFLTKDMTGQKIMDVLTKLFDCPETFSYESVRGTNVVLRKPCVVVLAGTTDDTLGKILPDTAFGGGFASRILFPFGADTPEERRKLWYTQTRAELALADELALKLKRVSEQFKGPFILSPDAIEWSEKWYRKIMKPTDRKLDGFVGRKHDHMLRTALVLRAGQELDNVIHTAHLQTAVAAVDEIQAWMPNAFGDVGKGEIKTHQDRIIRHVHLAGLQGMSHSDTLKKQYGYLDAEQFRKLMGTLIEQRFILRGSELEPPLKSTYYVCNCDMCIEKRREALKLAGFPEPKAEGNGQGDETP